MIARVKMLKAIDRVKRKKEKNKCKNIGEK